VFWKRSRWRSTYIGERGRRFVESGSKRRARESGDKVYRLREKEEGSGED